MLKVLGLVYIGISFMKICILWFFVLVIIIFLFESIKILYGVFKYLGLDLIILNVLSDLLVDEKVCILWLWLLVIKIFLFWLSVIFFG